jgi:hypothetical protein
MCAVLLLMSGAGIVAATPLQAYREQVRTAAAALDALPQWKKVESAANYTRRVEATLQQLREELLPVEAIEWDGHSYTVDNKWLAEALSRYEQLPVSDAAGREAELAQITERLKALGERLMESGAQAEGAGSDKNEEKKKLETILQRPEYSDKVDEGSALSRLWRRFRQWLRDLFPRSGPLEPGTSRALSGLTQIIVIGLTLLVIIYIFWKFTPMFRRGQRGGPREKPLARVVLGERLEPDQTSADLLAEAERLARAGDLRAAIRKGYIALLCELGDRKIIGLAQHKTNSDYLRALRQIEPLHAQMQQLTRSFEDHWYGFVPATETDWHAFRSGFQRIAGNE